MYDVPAPTTLSAGTVSGLPTRTESDDGETPSAGIAGKMKKRRFLFEFLIMGGTNENSGHKFK